MDERDILIAANAVELPSWQGILPYRAARRARYFALLPDDLPLAPQETDLVRAHFGFDEFRIPAHGLQRLPVEVLFVPMRDGPELSDAADLLQLKRRAIWQNEIRNRRIARLAKLLVSGNLDRLHECFSGIAAALRNIGPQRVAVEVEGGEHARALAQLLPGWKSAFGTWPDGPASVQPGPLDHMIVTTTAAASGKFDPGSLDVLIRADGGLGLPGLLMQPWLLREPDVQPLLLLDCNDRFHSVFRKHTRQRKNAYEAEEWYAPKTNPAAKRMEKFYAHRPRRFAR
jgi:hypothetical protein